MLTIIDPGISNTIQDAGRWGYQSLGVPVSGAMDVFALRAANALVRNSQDCAALEIHSPILMQSDRAHLIAVTGDARFTINDRAMPEWMSVFARGGAFIEIAPRRGWAYLAIHGGVDVPCVMNSRSTYARGGFGGLGRAIATGDDIPIAEPTLVDLVASAGRDASARVRAFANRDCALRVILGPHDDWFSRDAIVALTEQKFLITESADRMGYRLKTSSPSPLLRRERQRGEVELISCGVPLGAIQVPADGQPIVLMADHQTTGGYPIIATVIGADIPILAQHAPGDAVRFQIIAIETAQSAFCDMMQL